MYHKISDCIGILYRLICFLLGTQLMNWFKLMIYVWTHTRISQHHSLWDLVLCCGLLIRWWKYATCLLVSVLECFKCPWRLIKSDHIYFEVSIHVFRIIRIYLNDTNYRWILFGIFRNVFMINMKDHVNPETFIPRRVTRLLSWLPWQNPKTPSCLFCTSTRCRKLVTCMNHVCSPPPFYFPFIRPA